MRVEKVYRTVAPFVIPPVLAALLSLSTLFAYWPEMLNYPFFMDRGFLPYRDFSMVYTPGLPILLLGIYKVFGFTPAILHITGTLLLSVTALSTSLLVYALTKRRWLGVFGGSLAGYLIIAFEGNQLWFDDLLGVIFITVFYLECSFLRKDTLWKLVAAGLLSGLSLMVKQSAGYLLLTFPFVVYLYLAGRKVPAARLAGVLLSFSVPIVVIILVFVASLHFLGIYDDFLKWGVNFVFWIAKSHSGIIVPYFRLPSLRQSAVVIVLGLVPALVLINKKSRTTELKLAFAFLLVSFLLTMPNFAYHRLEVPLIFFVLIGAVGIAKSGRLVIFAGLVLTLAVATFVFQRHLSRDQQYWDDDARAVSGYINTNFPRSSIYSFNGPDLVYATTGRAPAFKPWFDQLAWQMEYAGDEHYQALIKSPPDLIVFRPLKEYSPHQQMIFNYMESNFMPVYTTKLGTVILVRRLLDR